MAEPRRQATTPVAVRRRASRLLLVGLLLPALIAGGGWLGMQFLDPVHWPIRAVQIDSELQRVDRQRLQARVVPLATTGLLLVDVDRVRRAVEEMPWVERAYVRRLWPDRLLVTVVEQVPLARWDDAHLVNSHGRLFAVPAEEHPAGLPELHGPPGREQRLAEQYRLLDGLIERAGFKVARLELDRRGAWRLRLAGGLEVELGRGDERLRLERLLGVLLNWPEELLVKAGRIDLRYANGLAIDWREPDDTPGTLARPQAGRTEERT